jgi:colanic acid/amylovoran biosynthesis protein
MPWADPSPFVQALHAADLYLVCGLGGLTDSARGFSQLVLDTTRLAIARGTPVAWLSQNVGPCEDRDLLALMRKVLPRAALIAVRERLHAPALLEALGVPSDRIVVTGDDAIESAYRARPSHLGHALGVNIRVAPYAGIDDRLASQLGGSILDFQRAHCVPMEPLPITRHAHARDADTLQTLLSRAGLRGDGGLAMDTPEQVIAAAGRCRAVVSGAYHAAVFALAQGVPTVCLAGSAYYHGKFAGLAELFGPGCQVIDTTSADAARDLLRALTRVWQDPDELRPSLLEAARVQVELGRTAYQRLTDLAPATRSTTNLCETTC